MNRIIRVSCLLFGLGLFLLVACSEEKKDPVLAEIGDGTIRVSHLKNYLSRRSASLDMFSPDSIRQSLEELIENEMFYQEALRIKLDKESEVQQSIQRLLTQRLIETKVERPTLAQPVEDQEIKAYYQNHISQYERAQQARLADIFIAVDPNATEAQRTDKRNKAEMILKEAIGSQGQDSEFGRMVDKYSDTPTQYPKGNTGYIDEEGNPLQLSPNLSKAAFLIKKLNQVYDQVVETPEGLHVIMLTGRRPAVRKDLNQVRQEIKQQIRYRNLKKAHSDFTTQLRAHLKININDEDLNTMINSLKATKK